MFLSNDYSETTARISNRTRLFVIIRRSKSRIQPKAFILRYHQIEVPWKPIRKRYILQGYLSSNLLGEYQH